MATELHEGTVAPGDAHAEGGLPQMNFETYPSQIFWLVLTFGFLLVVMSRVALPRIGGVIETRRQQIAGDLEGADALRKDAVGALQAYETALAGARSRAHALADENRKRIAGEVDSQKAAADAEGAAALADAEGRIAAMRQSATAKVREVAAEAAADIVERLVGERVSQADAMAALEGGRS